MAREEKELEAEIGQRLASIASALPDKIEVAALGVWDKSPYIALAVREALVWRIEELGRGAFEMVQRGDLASAILLTRGVIECTALMSRLSQVVLERATLGPDKLRETLFPMLHGWKKDPPEGFVALNVLTLLKHLDKRVGPVTGAYEGLSEFAHPNWAGVSLLFSRIDQENFVTYFGKFEDRTRAPRMQALNALAASLAIFEHDYNVFSDTMEAWLRELPRLDEPRR